MSLFLFLKQLYLKFIARGRDWYPPFVGLLPRWLQEPGFPIWVIGTQTLGPSFVGPLVGSWIRSGGTGTYLSDLRGFRYHWQWFYLFYHNANPAGLLKLLLFFHFVFICGLPKGVLGASVYWVKPLPLMPTSYLGAVFSPGCCSCFFFS